MDFNLLVLVTENKEEADTERKGKCKRAHGVEVAQLMLGLMNHWQSAGEDGIRKLRRVQKRGGGKEAAIGVKRRIEENEK